MEHSQLFWTKRWSTGPKQRLHLIQSTKSVGLCNLLRNSATPKTGQLAQFVHVLFNAKNVDCQVFIDQRFVCILRDDTIGARLCGKRRSNISSHQATGCSQCIIPLKCQKKCSRSLVHDLAARIRFLGLV